MLLVYAICTAMSGNGVYDHWHESYEGASSDGSAWLTGGDDQSRMLRGGSWNDLPQHCRSADRLRYNPDDMYYYLGFRVVCVMP